jgi:uncharacterized protein YbjT (DUF2867 family)
MATRMQRGVGSYSALLHDAQAQQIAPQKGMTQAADRWAVGYGKQIVRRAAEASGQKPRFVYLSAIGADESSVNAYNTVRGRLERELKEGTLPYVIARPSFILGDRDEKRSGESIGASVIDGALSFMGALGARAMRDRYSSIDARDLARGLVRYALDPSAARLTVTSSELR